MNLFYRWISKKEIRLAASLEAVVTGVVIVFTV
jgi:hypothetical protein